MHLAVWQSRWGQEPWMRRSRALGVNLGVLWPTCDSGTFPWWPSAGPLWMVALADVASLDTCAGHLAAGSWRGS